VDRAGAEEDGLNVRRLFCAILPSQGAEVALDADAAQHARVLRLTQGDELELFDGRGGRVHARLARLEKRSATCVATGPVERVAEGARVVLVQCQPKGTKLDEIIRMTTELGVSAIHVALSERCVARSEGGRAEAKAERWLRVAREAARQSEQAYVPEISPPAPLAQVLARAPHTACRVGFTERGGQAFPQPLDAREVWLVVGPEGGFSAADRLLLGEAGFVSASLGRAILRTETAAVVGVALGLERLGRLR
jgi:16S rRNA (uracil1498-N3)-methyltransferase